MVRNPDSVKQGRLPGWLPRTLFEACLIVFSVLLALVLNRWRDDVEQERRVAQAMLALQAELAANHLLVQSARSYHEGLEQAFNTAAGADAELPDLALITRGLLAPAPVMRVAWDSALNVGLANTIPYESLLQYSRVYEQQDQYAAINQTLNQLVYEQLMRKGVDALLRDYRNFTGIIHDTAERERALDGAYRNLLVKEQ